MGFFWDLFQQSQIQDQGARSSVLDERVAFLEAELTRTQALFRDVIGRLEEKLGGDLDEDGRIG